MLGMFLAAIPAYLLGSIPFGLVVAKAFALGDLRAIGSGNIGATNVLRTGNKLAAFLTLLGDAMKGVLAVVLARWALGEGAAGIAALAALAGHIWPVFIGFKGGKGVATFLGALLALSFASGVAACATWLLVAIVFRYSSLAALVATATAPIWTAFLYHWHGAVIVALMAALVIWKHSANIARLQSGTEPKIGSK